MRERWLLDLFCGAGGCTKGYQMAGFKVRGVDMHAQPRYVGEQFIQADALDYLQNLIASGEIAEFGAVHASPPCQAYSWAAKRWKEISRVDLVVPTRTLLQATGLPYVMENVIGAPLGFAITLCGTMFNLEVIRHRLFESNYFLFAPHHPAHLGTVRDGTYVTVAGHGGDNIKGRGSRAAKQAAMGISWMNDKELNESIPPKYTEHLGRQLLAVIDRLELLEERRAA